MSTPRIVRFGPSCRTEDGLFQVVKLSDSTYALVVGDIRVVLSAVLPIEPPSGVTINRFNDVSGVRRAWEDSEDGFASSGDHKSAASMEAAWPESSLLSIE
jgi:hypothetical protein